MNTKKIVIGILAHVDAGKTTLAESLLYLTGSIRQMGRVDHQDAFLDTFELERTRGITIFSKQAEISLGDYEVTLLDTPGHVDFSAEMERTLSVLDYAILVISGADGVQGHVETLWRLLKRYEVPVFLWINKMDQPGTDRAVLMGELTARLDEHCLDFGAGLEELTENLAMCDETVLEGYLETGSVEGDDVRRLIASREVFPCYFGSALRADGVEEFLQGLEQYIRCPDYPEAFGARVFKIARDDQGKRLTYMKITGGTLRVKMPLTNRRGDRPENDIWEEKADQIRIYSGAGYQAVQEAPAGSVCAVTGLTKTHSGEGLGVEEEGVPPILEPVLTYRIELPPECDVHQMYLNLCQLEEEEPELHMIWNEVLKEIHVQVMGDVQMEILQSLVKERFGVVVEFGTGSIVYKETIEEPVEGVGHFEPLRHYAEVHLLLEPLERGSGLQFASLCSEDVLDRNWQRLVLTHLEEKIHLGVLTGSEITDMKITLTAGRSHQKHTEGGDFRQATYRAVRQGLKEAKSMLLEPVYEYRLEIPSDKLGRAMSDIQKMYGSFQTPETIGEWSVLTGTAPVVTMRDYQREVTAYTGGRGKLSCSLKGYEPCHNADEVIAAMGYDSEKDTQNPTGSVFCAHGAGFVVPWDQVRDYMHVDSGWKQEESKPAQRYPVTSGPSPTKSDGYADEKELEEIFARTYGPVKRERSGWERRDAIRIPDKKENDTTKVPNRKRQKSSGEEYLLVDGYNIIFAWEELKELAQINMESARNKLMDILCNYQGYRKNTLILVFDAYKVAGGQGEVQKYHGIYVVYTKEAETADQYIEKTVHEIGRRHQVTVATSDATEQVIILGQGAGRMSAEGLRRELCLAEEEIQREYLDKEKGSMNYLLENLPEDLNEIMEEVRLGKKTFD